MMSQENIQAPHPEFFLDEPVLEDILWNPLPDSNLQSIIQPSLHISTQRIVVGQEFTVTFELRYASMDPSKELLDNELATIEKTSIQIIRCQTGNTVSQCKTCGNIIEFFQPQMECSYDNSVRKYVWRARSQCTTSTHNYGEKYSATRKSEGHLLQLRINWGGSIVSSEKFELASKVSKKKPINETTVTQPQQKAVASLPSRKRKATTQLTPETTTDYIATRPQPQTPITMEDLYSSVATLQLQLKEIKQVVTTPKPLTVVATSIEPTRIAVRRYSTDASPEVTRKWAEEFKSYLQSKLPELVSFHYMHNGNTFISVSEWKNEICAEKSHQIAEQWVGDKKIASEQFHLISRACV